MLYLNLFCNPVNPPSDIEVAAQAVAETCPGGGSNGRDRQENGLLQSPHSLKP
jgi:hypothetical protein